MADKFIFPEWVPKGNHWWNHPLLTYLKHPHPTFRCIRCHEYYMTCLHVQHEWNNHAHWPWLYPCDPANANRHAQRNASSTLCLASPYDPRTIYYRHYR